MKLFVYEWNFITKHDLYHAMSEQGIEYDRFMARANPRVKAEKEEFLESLKEALDKGKGYDAIFSVNFFPELADAAYERGIPYVSWTYDSPALGNVNESLMRDSNRIFVFDSAEYDEYCRYDVPNLYYLPLAVNTKRISRMKPTPMEQMKYHADVSLVGQLYQSDMDKLFPLFDEYGAGYIAAIINMQMNVYGTNIVKELVNDKVVERLCNPAVTEALLNNINNNFLHDVEELKGWALTAFLLKAVTNKERVLLLTLLAKYCHVKLFTTTAPKLPNVNIYGVVDYVEHMPLVFKCSKINLNITLRNIRKGIPQRVIDIMGCRALALTNYQEDLNRYFEDGRELLIYSSAEEALDKCRYYLKHEKEAEKIRENAYRLVREQFSYEHQLNRIWELSGLKGKL
ncbi:MAG: DUF3880 domain-containing protein [Butyrivibrio sp.]|nr:DUF3880 domain-containing protein [Muribaculum sp.]MCM1553017.1 DUF3880 domain-containing protein [Butyrivibrio sp.]